MSARVSHLFSASPATHIEFDWLVAWRKHEANRRENLERLLENDIRGRELAELLLDCRVVFFLVVRILRRFMAAERRLGCVRHFLLQMCA